MIFGSSKEKDALKIFIRTINKKICGDIQINSLIDDESKTV